MKINIAPAPAPSPALHVVEPYAINGPPPLWPIWRERVLFATACAVVVLFAAGVWI